MNFAADADELRRQEIARLRDALVPRLEALRSMTAPAFRNVIADMLERFGHTIVTDPAAPDLITTKDDKKFVTACADPLNLIGVTGRFVQNRTLTPISVRLGVAAASTTRW